MRMVFLLLGLGFFGPAAAQDLIFRKDHHILYSSIQGIELNMVAYKNWVNLNDKLAGISTSDIVKIQYHDGSIVWFDSLCMKTKPVDTIPYAMVWLVYRSGEDESLQFPCFFNGEFIGTLKNHSRMRVRVYQEGYMQIERLKNPPGPGLLLYITHGNYYCIAINVPNTQKIDPNERFRLTVTHTAEGFSKYLLAEFNSFKPFPKNDRILEWKKN
jgi:hypothetical protein